MNTAQKYLLLKATIERLKAELEPHEKEMEQLKKQMLGIVGGKPGSAEIDGGIVNVSKLRSGHLTILTDKLKEVLAHPVAGPIIAPFTSYTKDALKVEVVVLN